MERQVAFAVQRAQHNISLQLTPEVLFWFAGERSAGRLEGFAVGDSAAQLNSALCGFARQAGGGDEDGCDFWLQEDVS